MQLLKSLEKSTTTWFLLFVSLLFFLLRLPSLIEPYWYGDEGIYEIIGYAIRHGRELYTDIWDNKPPLLYFVYALFSGDQFSVRLLSLFVGLLTTFVFFWLCSKLLQRREGTYLATFLFAVFFAIPYLEGNIANAENFMLLPITLAGLIIYSFVRRESLFPKQWFSTFRIFDTPFSLFLAGILVGIAFLFKLVALFDFLAFGTFLVLSSFRRDHSTDTRFINHLSHATKSLFVYTAGFAAPFLVTSLFFLLAGNFMNYLSAIFFQNIGYVSYRNQFLIPQGLLLMKLSVLTATVIFLIIRRQYFSSSLLFIVLWFAFSLFNAFFSQRPYTHYLLVLLPSACLAFGFFVHWYRKHIVLFTVFLLLILLVYQSFRLRDFTKTIRYYQNFLDFISNKKDVRSFQAFFDGDTPKDYDLATFLRSHTNCEKDTLFVWGNTAQIYYMTKLLPPGKYTVAYHIAGEEALRQTQEAIDRQKPKFIVIMPDQPIPMNLSSYAYRFNIHEYALYERIY